jgi:hypothetical protein
MKMAKASATKFPNVKPPSNSNLSSSILLRRVTERPLARALRLVANDFVADVNAAGLQLSSSGCDL